MLARIFRAGENFAGIARIGRRIALKSSAQNQSEVTMTRKLAAEFFGTFWLVFGGCGAAVLAAGFPHLGIAFVGVALGLRPGLRADHGLCRGRHFGWAFQSGGLAGIGGRRPLFLGRAGALLGDAGHRRAGGGDDPLRHRLGCPRFRTGRLRLERLWRAVAGALRHGVGPADRGHADGRFPDRHPGLDPRRACRPVSRRSPSAWRSRSSI